MNKPILGISMGDPFGKMCIRDRFTGISCAG